MLRNLMNFPLSRYKNVTRSAILSGNVLCNRNLIMSGDILSISRFHISALNLNKRESFSVNRKMEMEYDSINKSISKIRMVDLMPDEDLPNRLFHGVPFKDLPIVHLKVSKNNTIITLSDAYGNIKFTWSCGLEGFKNAKEGTGIAAQLTAQTFARRAMDMGFKTVRLKVGGMGSGRSNALKGLIAGGLDIISVTDCTRVADSFPRPKKIRRI